jgi:hypothetical protein
MGNNNVKTSIFRSFLGVLLTLVNNGGGGYFTLINNSFRSLPILCFFIPAISRRITARLCCISSHISIFVNPHDVLFPVSLPRLSVGSRL